VVDMVVNQPPLRFVDRLLDGMQLLSKLEAAPAFSEHRYDASHVALSTLEALDDVWMRLMDMCGCHVSRISYGGGYASAFQPYGSKPSESGIFLPRTKAVILYPRILLPPMRSAGVPEIFSKRRNAVVAGRGIGPQKGTISKLHPPPRAIRRRLAHPPQRSACATRNVSAAPTVCEFAEPAFGNPPLNRPR
jgi:hypothetical protein